MKTGIEPVAQGSDAPPGVSVETGRGFDFLSASPNSSPPRGSTGGTPAKPRAPRKRGTSRHVAAPSEDAAPYRRRVETPKATRDALRDRMDERAMLERGEAAWSAARPSQRLPRACRASMGR